MPKKHRHSQTIWARPNGWMSEISMNEILYFKHGNCYFPLFCIFINDIAIFQSIFLSYHKVLKLNMILKRIKVLEEIQFIQQTFYTLLFSFSSIITQYDNHYMTKMSMFFCIHPLFSIHPTDLHIVLRFPNITIFYIFKFDIKFLILFHYQTNCQYMANINPRRLLKYPLIWKVHF